MDYTLISCDDHCDLQYLPVDLWTSRLPANLQDRAPHVEERDGRMVWVCDGAVWGAWAGRPPTATGPKANYNAFDRGGVTEGERRPAVARLRLEDMDRDGVWAHVVFGPVTSMNIEDAELRSACLRAYNDWLAEFCSEAPDRLVGVGMLPPEDPEEAASEVYRLAKLGIRQANLQVTRVNPRLHDSAWEPLWNAFEETGLLMSWHVFVFFNSGPTAPEFGKTAGVFTNTKMFVSQFLDPFVDLFAWGILERHPRLRLVMAESGLGWLPWVVQELDYRHWRLWEAKDYWATRGGIDLQMKPSELFKRQIFVTFQEDYVAMSLLPFYGAKNVLWASDYPHPDSTWPNSQAVLERQMTDLPADVRRRLTHDNAAELYGLGVRATAR